MKVESRHLDNAAGHEGGSSGASYVMIRRNYKAPARDITSDIQDAKRLKTDNSYRQQERRSVPATIPTQNGFSLLDGVAESDPLAMETANPRPQEKKKRFPPISIVNKGTKQIRELLNIGNIPQHVYHMKAVKTGVQLTVSGSEEGQIHHPKIISSLKESNVEFFTYTAAENQPVKITLSGLSDYSTQELKDELEANGVHAKEIKIFSQKKVGPEPSTLYLLYFEKGTVKLTELQKVKTLFSTVVMWRYFTRKPSDVVQCFRCQRFGHGMQNCNVSPLCVKCGEKHPSAACSLPVKADLPKVDQAATRSKIRCANCSGNHTANYLGCVARKNFLQAREATKTIRQQRKSSGSVPLNPRNWPSLTNDPPRAPVQMLQTTARSSRSYSEVLTSANTDAVADDTNDLFTLSEFMCLARDLFARLKGCRNKEQQFMALSELMIKYVYHV